MRVTTVLLAALLGLTAACGDGPREDAGEVADNRSGAVDGKDSIDSGPAETLGEKQDDVAEDMNRAKEAKADALEDAAEERREAADQQADALENQAEQTRGK
ncbi:MAG TPA: hypothetical protein VF631_10575 [Allosphingosinicella sp.]|jgi:hypothetical protein|uniref:hypothetical protein n=1 Tax=Allosphingosinicella sp. TaxID=2823234 RepID=UPI002F288C82